MSRSFGLVDRCLRTRRHSEDECVLACPEEQLWGKVLMDDIEGILMVVSLYVDGGTLTSAQREEREIF